MGRELVGKGATKTPTVILNKKENVKFKGRFIGQKTTKIGNVYEFAVIDGDAPIKIKVGEKQYQDVDVAEGDRVSVFGNTQIDDKMSEAQPGEVIEITFLGKKVNDKTGRTYNDYRIVVE